MTRSESDYDSPFWSLREQKSALWELLKYVQEKFDQGLVYRCVQDPAQYTFSIDTYLGYYHDVLFLEIERQSANWTEFEVTLWELKQIRSKGPWVRFRTFPEWHNGRYLGTVSREAYVRVDIKLLNPEMTSAEMEEELADVDREME